MKVLLCTGRYYMGGIEKYVHDLSINLSDRNIEITLLIFYKIKNDDIKFLKAKKINIYELNGKNGRDLKMIFNFFKIIKRIKPNIIHLNVIPIFSFIPLLFFKGKTVYTIHQMDTNYLTNFFFNSIIDGVIFLSESVKNHYTKLKYLSKPTSEIISNGVEIYANNQYKIPEECINLVMVSRLAQDKQPHLAIEILNFLEQNSALKYRLTLVGDGDTLDESYVKQITRSVTEKKLTKNVTFKGWQKEVVPFLLEAHGFLMLSRKECFPYNVLEAMSVGVPIFSFNVEGGLIDMHQNEFTGIMIDTNEPIFLAQEIDAVFSSNRWQVYSENAYQNAKQFSVNAMVNKTMQFYNTILQK
ncbi:glycosyltransferase family 4 protein [Flavobacterium sp. GT2N3]|uniref:glycosyltransferase family 4 protein n=1 Tax=unclassified Flavobacterium TaxID=196869 RepID=UPI003AAAB33D